VLPGLKICMGTLIIQQQNQLVANALAGQLSGGATLELRDLFLKNPSDVFVARLKSRTVEDALVNQFHLRKIYDVKRYRDARKILEKRNDIDPEKEAMISIQVGDRDPKRAADIANAWVDALRTLDQTLALTAAAQRRAFFEQKLAQERDDLAKPELALQQVQQNPGIIQPDAQTRVLIGAVAEVRAQIAAKEVQLQSPHTYATKNNPDVKRTRANWLSCRLSPQSFRRWTAAAPDPVKATCRCPRGLSPRPISSICGVPASRGTRRASMTFSRDSWRGRAPTKPRMQPSSRRLIAPLNQKRGPVQNTR
jgi:hypothetical protein